MFGSGTASVVCPVERIRYRNLDLTLPFSNSPDTVAARLHKELTDIQVKGYQRKFLL